RKKPANSFLLLFICKQPLPTLFPLKNTFNDLYNTEPPKDSAPRKQVLAATGTQHLTSPFPSPCARLDNRAVAHYRSFNWQKAMNEKTAKNTPVVAKTRL